MKSQGLGSILKSLFSTARISNDKNAMNKKDCKGELIKI